MDPIFIEQFEKKFDISFTNIKNIEDLGVDTDDDGIYHFIYSRDCGPDISVDEVNTIYSFDTNENIWLEKNIHKNEIVQRVYSHFLLDVM